MANPNPNDDTEFNDVLRRHGILPPKPAAEVEVTEAQIQSLVDQAVHARQHGKPAEERTLDELDELEDELDERVFEEFRCVLPRFCRCPHDACPTLTDGVVSVHRRKRLQEMQAQAARARFGELVQVSESQYKGEINEAGAGVWVVVCLFQSGITACGLLLQRLASLARRFPATKFVKIVATDAIRNYPDRNCPTLLIYHNGDLKRQLVGLGSLSGLTTTEAGPAPHIHTHTHRHRHTRTRTRTPRHKHTLKHVHACTYIRMLRT
jgi:hypothetical protein